MFALLQLIGQLAKDTGLSRDVISRLKGDGDELKVDADTGVIQNDTTGQTIQCKPVPPFMKGILDKGGLIPYVQDRLAGRA